MPASSATQRPYRIFFKAPALGTYLDRAEATVKTFVDTGLSQDDVNELVHPDTLRRLDLANLLLRGSTIIFCICLGLGSYGVAGLTAGFAHPLVAVPAVAAALALAAFVIRARVQAKRAGDRLHALQADLISSGRLASTENISNAAYADLQRIDKALTALQESRGASFDDDARTAAVAVLRRDVHEPSKRQREIADSSATDENSNKIRAIVTASTAKWRSDVALAEHLILALEGAAGQKTPAGA